MVCFHKLSRIQNRHLLFCFFSIFGIAKYFKYEYINFNFLFFCRQARRIWVVPRPKIWWELMDICQDDAVWRKHFRMSKASFEFIVASVGPYIIRQATRLRQVHVQNVNNGFQGRMKVISLNQCISSLPVLTKGILNDKHMPTEPKV